MLPLRRRPMAAIFGEYRRWDSGFSARLRFVLSWRAPVLCACCGLGKALPKVGRVDTMAVKFLINRAGRQSEKPGRLTDMTLEAG